MHIHNNCAFCDAPLLSRDHLGLLPQKTGSKSPSDWRCTRCGSNEISGCYSFSHSHCPSGFCLYPDFCLSSNFTLFLSFLSSFFIYFSSLSRSAMPDQNTWPVNGHSHWSFPGCMPSSASSARSSSMLFRRLKSKNLTHISVLSSSGCCSLISPVKGSR